MESKNQLLGSTTIQSLPISIPGVLIINSKSQEGKSHFIKYAMHELQDKIDYVIGISRTAMDEGNLVFIPKKFKFTSWPGNKTKQFPKGETKHALMNLIDEQLKIPKSIRPVAAVVIEDEYNSLRDPLLMEIASRPYHYNIWLVIAVNWVTKVCPDIREGAWQVVLFKITSKKGLEAAYEAYGEEFWDFKAFAKKLHENTGDYRFMFRNLKGKDNNEASWRCYKAPSVIPNFVIQPRHLRKEMEE